MSNGTSTTTIREVNAIPEMLTPFYTGTGEPGTEQATYGLLGAGQEFYSRPFQDVFSPYTTSQYYGPQGRVAGLEQRPGTAGGQFYSGIMGLTQPGAFGTAQGLMGQAGQGLTSSMGTQAQNVTPQQLQQFQMQGPNAFGQAQAEQYMSPYMQNVVDVAKRKAMEDAQRGQLQANLGAGRKGALGSSGQLLATTERERNLGTQLGDIQVRGLQDAYANAQSQFERDRAAQMMAQQRNLEAQLGVQQLGSGQALTAQQANQQAALQAAQQRMSAAQGLGSLGAQAGQLGTLTQAADIDRLKMLGAYGELERGLEQQRRDIGFQDVMREIQYPEQRLMGMSSLLRGVPMGDRIGSTTQVTPPPSFLSQLSGLGLTGLSLYNLANPNR
jgi:hypothetical protein